MSRLYEAQNNVFIRLEWVLNRYRGAVLRGEEGTGKTIIAATVAQGRSQILWVAPAKDLKSIKKKVQQYQDEFLIAYRDTFDFISYNGFGDPSKISSKKMQEYELVIFDECHHLRNWRASWTQRFVKSNFMKYLFLSGTPMVRTPKDFIYILRKCGLFKHQTTKDIYQFYFNAKPSRFGDFMEFGEFQNKEHFQTNVDKICAELTHNDIDKNAPNLRFTVVNVPLDTPIEAPKDIEKYTEIRKAVGMAKVDYATEYIKNKNLKTSLILVYYHEVAKKIAKKLDLPVALTAKTVYSEFEKIKKNGGQLVTTLGLTSSNLDLNECDNVFMVESTYSFPTDRQSIRRCQRLGKVNDVNVYYFAIDGDFNLLKSFSRSNLLNRSDGSGLVFRPSSMKILEQCPGSFWIHPDEDKPDYITAASMQGTVNHSVVERFINNPKAKITDDIPAECVPMIEYSRRLASAADKSGAEVRVKASPVYPELTGLRGTLDFFAWSEKHKTLIVIDYKNGNSPVAVKDNLQLLTYTLLISDTYLLKPQKVKHIIYQKQKKKECVYDGDIIETTRGRIKKIIKRVLGAKPNPLEHLNPGVCDFFCPAKKFHK